jgi:hypothetical protein
MFIRRPHFRTVDAYCKAARAGELRNGQWVAMGDLKGRFVCCVGGGQIFTLYGTQGATQTGMTIMRNNGRNAPPYAKLLQFKDGLSV